MLIFRIFAGALTPHFKKKIFARVCSLMFCLCKAFEAKVWGYDKIHQISHSLIGGITDRVIMGNRGIYSFIETQLTLTDPVSG